MKKGMLLFSLLFVIIIGAKAQDIEEIQVQGRYSLDVNLDPSAIFDASAGSMFNMPRVRLKMYQPDGSAYRLNVGLNLQSQKNYQDADGDIYTKSSHTSLQLAPGIEWPLSTGRVRPYYGVELPISLATSKQEIGAFDNTSESKDGSLGVGLNAILGLDYNFGGGFFLGIEFNPGLRFINNFDRKVDGDVAQKGGNTFGFGTGSTSGIRAGIRF